MGIFRSLSTYRSLDARQRAGVRSALREAKAVKTVLKDSGYESARAYLQARPEIFSDSTDPDSDALLADRAIRAYPRKLLCLERSLVVQKIAGEGSEIRLGVAIDGEYRFHAWVERDGVVLNDSSNVATEFKPFGAQQTPSGNQFDGM